MIVLKRYLGLFFLLLILVGCGFHLRGAGQHIGLKHSIWKIDNGGEMTPVLTKILLRRSGVSLQDSDMAAVIKIEQLDFKRQTQSINRYGGVDDFLYALRVKAQVYYQQKPWGEPMDISIERYMSYRTDSLVVQEEERHLKDEMYMAAADTIVNRLYFLPDLVQNPE